MMNENYEKIQSTTYVLEMATYLLLVTLCITNEPPDEKWRGPVLSALSVK